VLISIGLQIIDVASPVSDLVNNFIRINNLLRHDLLHVTASRRTVLIILIT